MKQNNLIWYIIGIFFIVTIVLFLCFYPIPLFQPQLDPSKFHSEIYRNVPTDDYLHILYLYEDINQECAFFYLPETYGNRLEIENITELIEKEEAFLHSYKPELYTKRGTGYHNFIYHGIIQENINKLEFLSSINISPYHLFYYNFTNENYTYAISTDYDTWKPNIGNINDIIDYIYSQLSTLLFVNQTIVISDIFGPLAGQGTSFSRLSLCSIEGKPLFFISNEGPWWIS